MEAAVSNPQPKRTIPHHIAAYGHVRNRMMERLGILIDDEIYRRLNNAIFDGTAVLLAPCGDNRSGWLLEINGQKVVCIYDETLQMIVTVMLPTSKYWKHKVKERLH